MKKLHNLILMSKKNTNCKKIYIKLDLEKGIISQRDLYSYSILLNGNKTKIINIPPVLDILEGKYKENYEQKFCPLSY